MKSLIEEMYNGTLHPFGEIDKSEEYSEMVEKYLTAEKDFLEKYPDCKDAFEKVISEFTELENYIIYKQFMNGFRTGTKIMIEILDK